MIKYLLILSVIFLVSSAQLQGLYGQCAGVGWTGGTQCDFGLVCTFINAYFSQCLPPSVAKMVARSLLNN
ncbi:unnamed protein product [Brachionus calyciflorus]|uniref:CBM1 domain-containing protein n=1 Tax=Brachionus calyciflorus TaxID=104777 RepID=A0A814DTC5_9BILA|nr:unnamed protein product [Brachionus calyciflorus]